MNRSKRGNSWKISLSRCLIWGTILIAVLILNYWYLNKYLSFNTAYITDFIAPEDSLAEYRNPALMGILYTVDDKIPDFNSQQGYFNYSKEYKPKIVIVPFTEKLISVAALGKVYSLLQKSAAQTKNIILLGSDDFEKEAHVFVPQQNKLSTGSATIAINEDSVNQLKLKNSFYSSKSFNKENRIYEQIPFIKKAFPKAKIIPLVYGNITPEKLAESLKEELLRSDTFMIVPADLSCDEKSTQQNINNCGTKGIDTAIYLSKQLNYHIQVFDLAQRGKTPLEYERWMIYPDSEDSRPLKKMSQELKNMEDFISFYGNDLWLIARTAFEKAVSGRREFSPSRRSFPEDIFNRGAAFVYVFKNGEQISVSGNILPNTSVAQSIADNAYAAGKEIKIKPDEINQISLKIYLLSNFEKISYKNEYDLIKKIKKGIDGIMIQDGNRQGVFLPIRWQEVADEKEFMKKLKIKAGLNPNYWNSRIKVYRFRTVEVTHEN